MPWLMLFVLADTTNLPIPLPVQLGVAIPFVFIVGVTIWWLMRKVDELGKALETANDRAITQLADAITKGAVALQQSAAATDRASEAGLAMVSELALQRERARGGGR